MSLTGKGNQKSVDAALSSSKQKGPSFGGVGSRSEKSLNAAKASTKGGKSFKGVGSRSEDSLNAAKKANKSSSIKDGGTGKVAESRHDKRFGGMNGKKGI